jgi:hypothetical protein
MIILNKAEEDLLSNYNKETRQHAQNRHLSAFPDCSTGAKKFIFSGPSSSLAGGKK